MPVSHTIASQALQCRRTITVYLPPRYNPRRVRPYPLLVLNDGQNLFQADRAFAHETWRVAETADALIRARRVTPLVIAGIDHAGLERASEFTPTAGRQPGTGQASRYLAFVVDELMPFLAHTYPVSLARETTGFGGSSLGALVAIYAAIVHPRRFGRLLLMSPSVWWDRRVIVRMLHESADASALRARVWLDIGLEEGAKAVADTRALRAALRRGLRPSALKYLEDREGDHSERSWARRFGSALEFLYGPQA